MRNALLVCVLALPFVPGCAAAAVGVGVGLIVSQDVLDNNTYVTQLNKEVGHTWQTVKMTLSDESPQVIELDENLRVCRANINGSQVTVAVESYDHDTSIMRVSARRYGLNDGETARQVQESILIRLDR